VFAFGSRRLGGTPRPTGGDGERPSDVVALETSETRLKRRLKSLTLASPLWCAAANEQNKARSGERAWL
jgi:hypothetical protein